LTRNRPLDQKDVDIIGALDRLGGKTSTEELSQVTNIPARTVRYRLTKMRDAGVIYPTRTFTHERKLGLGEYIILADTTPGSTPILEELFESIDSIYYWSSTYGRYNGCLINSLYSLTTPNVSRRLMEAFQKEGLISNYYMFDATDYEHKNGDFSKLDPKLGWQYCWSEWHKKIKKNLKSKSRKIHTKCDENPKLIKFDNSDFGLLRSLFDDALVPQKDLAKKFSLSETQVTKRIRRLENEGVIKGFGSSFKMSEPMIDFNLYINIEEPAARIMNNFYAHPFPGSIMQESRTRWGIRMAIPAAGFHGFLEGIDLMKPYLKSYALQLFCSHHRDKNAHPYDLFNIGTHKWETPISDYLAVVSDVMAKHTRK
jgi:DNA-binding Lrp family transcriptional regulator